MPTDCLAPPDLPAQDASNLAYKVLQGRETATVQVNGKNFYNWETVFVQSRIGQPYPVFRFTCAEDTPVPNVWTDLQFQPGDECYIYLGGILAISGVIMTRQTAYNAESHGVMLQGYGVTFYASRASHVDKDGNFDNMTYQAIVERVLAPFEAKPCFIGTINPTPFPTAQINPGETIWDFFERLGRDVGVVVGSDAYGNFLFYGDWTSDRNVGRLIEGRDESGNQTGNILSCQASITMVNFYSIYVFRSQQPASDDVNGTAASETEASAPGRAKKYSPLVTPAEQPLPPNLLHLRAQNEAKWLEGTLIEVVIVVQGWFRPDGTGLWTVGDLVDVYSPSAMITEVLGVQTVTFTQDSTQGTQTSLELVAPWKLNNFSDFNFSNPNAPIAPGNGTISTQPATTPPAVPQPDPPPGQIMGPR
jgi:prophage tail gpP-like protein